MTSTDLIRKQFLSLPSLALMYAIRSQNEKEVFSAFDSDAALNSASSQLVSHRPLEYLALHLVGCFRLPNTRCITIVRALGFNTTIPAAERRIYEHLSLRFTHVSDAMSLWRELRKSMLTEKLERTCLGTSPALLFPETSVGNPLWLEINLRTHQLEPVQMNSFHSGFSDELYLMSCVGDFEDLAPETHWFSDLPPPSHVVTADFYDL